MSIRYIRYLLLAQSFFCLHAITLILDPAGDAKHPGRLIGHTFERTATLLLARQIHTYIEKKDKKIVVLFSRLPGEHKDTNEMLRYLQQSNPHLFVHLCIYQHQEIKPRIHLYMHALQENALPTSALLMPVTHAQAPYHAQSLAHTNFIYTSLQKNAQRVYDLHEPIAIPCAVLKPVACPALLIEIGIQEVNDLYACITPLAESIIAACTQKTS